VKVYFFILFCTSVNSNRAFVVMQLYISEVVCVALVRLEVSRKHVFLL